MKNFMPFLAAACQKKLRAFYGVAEKARHFPIGQFSVAMRSFAQVEHPHFMQRPVLPSAFLFQNSQPLQMSSRD
jgi:hypothetical protein